MKRLLSLILFMAIFFEIQSQLPVYVNLVSHNEDSYGYLDNPDAYYAARNKIIAFALRCRDAGVKWNYGTDYVLLQAVKIYDTASVVDNTNGKNLLKWLAEDMGVECDPHTHSSKYNYADVAYLFTELDVNPSTVISGMIYNTYQNGDLWMDYQDSVAGDSFPDFKWKPQILWGGGTPGHTADPQYWGMWKPLDTANFFVHNPDGNLIDYGQGCRLVVSEQSAQDMIEILDTLIAKRDRNQIPQDGFYCTSIFFEEADLNRPQYRVRLDSIIDLINLRVAQGKMQWENITDVAEIWKNQFNENPFYVSCDFNDIYTEIYLDISRKIIIFPNPAKNQILVKNIPKNTQLLYISDITGKILYSVAFPSNNLEINISFLSDGMYFLNCLNNASVVSLKFIKK